MIRTNIYIVKEKLLIDELNFSQKYNDLEDETYRVKTKDITGTSIDEYSFITRGSRLYAWVYRPFSMSNVIVRDISDWTEIAMFTLQCIYFPPNAVPLINFDFHAIRESGAGGKAQFRVVLVGETDGNVEDETIFEGYVYGTFNRFTKDVYLSELAGGTGNRENDEAKEHGWCIRVDVNLESPATGITLYKESAISLIYEF